MAEKMKKPEIRFKGFAGKWEKYRLGDLGSVGMNRRIFKNQTSAEGDVPFYKIGTFGNEPDAFISRGLFEKYKSKYPYPEKGDILISASGSIGRIVEYKGEDEYFQDSNIVWLQHDNRIVNSFLKHFYSVVKWSGLEGSTIKRLYNKNILDTPILLPDPEEQEKIGEYFTSLDNLITLRQRKYDKLVNVKKAMLEKMFPKEGADVPEIRFKGFSVAWDERKLEEIADILDGDRGNNYPNGNELQKNGHTLFLNATNVTKNGFKFNNNQYITEEKSNSMGNGKLVENDIVLTSRGSIGHIAWYNENIQKQVLFARVNSGMLILRSKDFVIPCFVAQFLKSPLGKKQIDVISFGSAQPQLTKKDVSNYIVTLPRDSSEQRKVGVFFEHLDQLITLQHRELEKLKNIKKACLEKMFI